MDGWAWAYSSASTIRHGVHANAAAKVLKAKLALNWTGPYIFVAVDPSSSADAPDGLPLGDNLLYSDLPSDLPGSNYRRQVAIKRCKPCSNPHDSRDMHNYLPIELPQYVLNSFLQEIPSVPRHSRRRCMEKITARQSVSGRDGVIAVLYKDGTL